MTDSQVLDESQHFGESAESIPVVVEDSQDLDPLMMCDSQPREPEHALCFSSTDDIPSPGPIAESPGKTSTPESTLPTSMSMPPPPPPSREVIDKKKAELFDKLKAVRLETSATSKTSFAKTSVAFWLRVL